MNSSDAVSETNEPEVPSEIPDAVTSLMETLAPSAARGVGSGNFAIASGVISLFRGVQSFRKGDRKRGLLRVGVGLFWVGVALAQRRRKKKKSSGSNASQVADTGSNLEDAVEPGERETDHATGSEVVNTTDADIEESDTAPEVETKTEIDRDAEDVDQRDVAETDEVESVAETDTETADDESEDDEIRGDASEEDETESSE